MINKRDGFKKLIPQIVIDAVCIFFSYWIAFVLRFVDEGGIPFFYVDSFRLCIPWMTLVCLAVFALFRFYSTMWQFASLDELLQIFFGTTAACLLITIMGYVLFPHLIRDSYGYSIQRFPITVYVMGWVLTLFFIGASRFGFRLAHRRKKKVLRGDSDLFSRVMVIGAGEMGSMIIKDLKSSPQSQGTPVVAVDDDKKKRGTRINGVKVAGGRESIQKLVDRYRVDQIILAIATASNRDKHEILRICAATGCKLKTVPALYEILEGNADPHKVRDVNIVDLLGRDEINLDVEKISDYLKNKTILVTGGGGSIGSELCRQIAIFHPRRLIVFDIYENNAYELQNELHRRYPKLDMDVVIGSVRDKNRLRGVFDAFRPDVVFHAAAHKHVPLMELSPGEAVKNNVFGTLNVAQTCDEFHVKRMVLISTDKAVNPTNIMGATKRICELIVQYFSRHSKTGFAAVRFGNVLGSSGSVIPLFMRQIEEGGPVTVTDPEIVRFFMTIPEAARLVIQAGGMAKGGEIFVLDMGQPVKIVDLARNLIRLSGLKPDEDIKIQYTGLRPGEKLYEELLLDCEGGCRKTSHELIYIGSPIPFDENTFLSQLESLRAVAGVNNPKMLELVHELVPTYSGHAEKTDLLAK